jgi:hypothetical protein
MPRLTDERLLLPQLLSKVPTPLGGAFPSPEERDLDREGDISIRCRSSENVKAYKQTRKRRSKGFSCMGKKRDYCQKGTTGFLKNQKDVRPR